LGTPNFGNKIKELRKRSSFFIFFWSGNGQAHRQKPKMPFQNY